MKHKNPIGSVFAKCFKHGVNDKVLQGEIKETSEGSDT